MKELLSDLIIEKVHSVVTVYNDTGASGKRTNRERWAIIMKYEGETIYRNLGREIVSSNTHMVILPRGCCYEWRCLEAGHFVSVEFESTSSSEEILSFPVRNSAELLSIIRRMEYRHMLRRDLYRMESIRDTYSLILKLAEGVETDYVPEDKAKKLLPAVEHMIENYTAPMTNDALAKRAGISTVYFRKLFREVYGVSPMEYVKNLRIKKAREMLSGDYGSITDIACSLGYASIYDFSRDFKKHVGLSPSKYADGAL